MLSSGSVSLSYRAIPESNWGSNQASWLWAVSQSVPATDLSKKGGDDRNFAIYFIFLPDVEAKFLKDLNVRKVLNSNTTRVLVYVWGGQNERGSVVSNPHLGDRGKTIILRSAGTGVYSEAVNLAADYRRTFGEPAGALVGMAVSADSDDTGSRISGTISTLLLNK